MYYHTQLQFSVVIVQFKFTAKYVQLMLTAYFTNRKATRHKFIS
jgi:hypothetical protein